VSRSLRKLLHHLWQHPGQTITVLFLLALISFGGLMAYDYAWAEYHFQAAQRAADHRDFAAALRHLTKCLQVRSSSGETHFLAARAARRNLAYDEAARHLKEAQRLGYVREVFELEQMLTRAQRGDLDPVQETLLSSVLQGHPDSLLILEALAHGYMRSYRLPEARHVLDLWLERQPDAIQALRWRGDAEEHMRSVDPAIDDYRRVLELDPTLDAVRLHLGEVLLLKGRSQEAQEQLQIVCDRQPQNAAAFVGLARCYRLLSDTDKARAALDAALALNPDEEGAISLRGRLEMETGHAAEAEPWLRRAAANAPYDRETVYSYYLCLRKLGKDDLARKYKEKADQIDAQLGRLGKLTALIEKSPHDPALRHEAGVIFLESGQPKEGLRWLQSALAEDPSNVPTHLTLAEYFEKTGERERAAWHRRAAGQAH
jgi:tetratricopeptide (TPR) repeat protein